MWYKMTDSEMRTYGGFQWELGKWVVTDGKGGLCAAGWIHVFGSARLAALVCRGLVSYEPTRLFECEVEGKELRDGTFKAGFSRVRLVREIAVPTFTREQYIAFAIQCGLAVASLWPSKQWCDWAEKWLSGVDRSRESARAAVAAAVYADARAAAYATASAACAAANTDAAAAAHCAVYAARTALAMDAIDFIAIAESI